MGMPSILLFLMEQINSVHGALFNIIQQIKAWSRLYFEKVKFREMWMWALALADINNSILQAEGIFRINAENSQEEYVRDQLNRGVVPDGIDVHCLAGLIKVKLLFDHAWTSPYPLFYLMSYSESMKLHDFYAWTNTHKLIFILDGSLNFFF